MTPASVGLLAGCWLATNIQKRSPYKGYRYIYVCMLVCWSFSLSLFFLLFFYLRAHGPQPTNQQTNIGPKFAEIHTSAAILNVGCTRQQSPERPTFSTKRPHHNPPNHLL